MLAIGDRLRKAGRDTSDHIVLYPGVELFFIYYSDKFYHFHHEELPGMLQINYCLEGRMGWEMNFRGDAAVCRKPAVFASGNLHRHLRTWST